MRSNNTMFGAKHIKCEAIIQCLAQDISNAKQYYNVWCKTNQMRSNNLIFVTYDIVLYFFDFCYFLASVFRLSTPQNQLHLFPFNTKNDQCIEAHIFDFLPNFCHQYFGCLPLKISSICLHSIRKMISATRRIFFVFYSLFGISISGVYPSKLTPSVSIQ